MRFAEAIIDGGLFPVPVKDELRLRFRALRDANPQRVRQSASETIAAHAFGLARVKQAKWLLAYSSLGSEVDMHPVMRRAHAHGQKVVLPRMEGRGRLLLHEWNGLRPLVVNRLGIGEPDVSEPAVPESQVEVVFVPGLAFDRRGGRLGYGGGYYDRLLRTGRHAFRIGLAFRFQIVENLPSTHLDEPMDCLVTEDGVHELPHRRH